MILALLLIGAMSWFAQNFLVLYLLTPLINRVLRWLQHKYYAMLLAISTIIWFVIPTALNLWPNLPHATFGFKHIFSFVVFYAMGAYIKLHGFSIKLCGSYITKNRDYLEYYRYIRGLRRRYSRRCTGHDRSNLYETYYVVP